MTEFWTLVAAIIIADCSVELFKGIAAWLRARSVQPRDARGRFCRVRVRG